MRRPLPVHALFLALAFPAFPAIAETPPGPAPETPLPGVALVGFGDNAPWRTVNDDVLGGRSEGGHTLDAGVLTFEGVIDTNGGGFSSVDHPLVEGVPKGTDRLVLRVRAVDDRPHRVHLRDRRPGPGWRGGRVLHRAKLPITEPGVWQTPAALRAVIMQLMKISTLLDHIDSGHMALPEFQRGYV